MDMTGWVQGQVFVQTVDEQEVEQVTGFLNAHGLTFQVLTLSERMVRQTRRSPTGRCPPTGSASRSRSRGFPR